MVLYLSKMKNNQPFFSIIIPTLNEEKYLPRLLKCLVRQTITNFEVIICDGQSEDKTVEVANEFKAKNQAKFFVRVVNSPVRNVSFQRNLGAKEATGKYLQFIDADSKCCDNYLEKVYEKIQKTNAEVATTWLVPDSTDSRDLAFVMMTNLIIETSRHFDQPFFPGFNIITKRAVFFKIGGFKPEVKLGEDFDFVKRAQRKNYSLTVFRNPKMVMSLRRLRREGRLKVVRDFAKNTFHTLAKGPITSPHVKYPMGGHYHSQKKEENNRFFQYIQRLSSYGRKKAVALFREMIEFE